MCNQHNIKSEEKIKKIGIILAIILILIFFAVLFLKKNKNTQLNQGQKKSSAKLFIIPKTPVFEQNEPFDFIIKRRIKLRGNFSKVKLTVGLPVNVKYRQKLSDMEIIPAPHEIIQKGDKKYAIYYLKNSYDIFNITYKGSSVNQTYTINKAKKLNKNIDGKLSEKDFTAYTSAERGIESDRLKRAAEKIPDGKDRLETVKNIFDYVDRRLKYNENIKYSERGAYAAFILRSGTCTEFSSLLVALCRAKKIPARLVRGFNLPFTDEIKNEYTSHAWAEVWFDEYGWINIDPTISYDENIVHYINKHNISYFDVRHSFSFER